MRRLVAAGLAAVAGCAQLPTTPRQPVAMYSTFEPAEHDPFMQPGPGVVRGQGFLRQRGGGTVTCAGSSVVLAPATSFFREYFSILRGYGKPPDLMPTVDRTGYKGLLRRGQCDAQGNFTFDKLPAGKWIVSTQVVWTVGNQRQGGMLMREIEVAGPEPVNALLSDRDFAAP